MKEMMKTVTDAKILIVDDQEANVLLVQSLLEEHGYERIRTITDPRLTVETVQEFDPDLILLDL